MSLLSDREVRSALDGQSIKLDPFNEDGLKAASYDIRLGKKAIITKSLSLDELRDRIEKEIVPELDVERERSITIPGGAFALVTTLERIATDGSHVGHIGMKTYYVRKGLTLLSGLQIDPWWDGVLVLGLANVSPQMITLEYQDDLCTIEFHRLSQPAEKRVPSDYMAEQREGRIPRSDKDYLRTIETMSVSDLTQALLRLSTNVETISDQIKRYWYGFGAVILVVLLTFILALVQIIRG